MSKIFTSIGLMSGTSMDGIDLALIKTDGKDFITRQHFAYFPYQEKFKQSLRALIGAPSTLQQIKDVENEFTSLNAKAVNEFLQSHKINRQEVDAIAFHGHTILHNAGRKTTWQIGNAHLLAHQTKIGVVADFRGKDLVMGGHGAPLVPIYHFHLFAKHAKPFVVLNIGGISNITHCSSDDENKIEAFDVCFGNAPFDDLIKNKLQKNFDENGELANSGVPDLALAESILQNDIFYKKPPKSFDRNDFSSLLAPINNLPIADALATLAYIHARALQISIDFLSVVDGKKIKNIFVCGGGRKNAAIMQALQNQLVQEQIEVRAVEDLGLNGDAIEAEAFAFLGVRHLKNLPISFQKTTGISPENDCVPVSPQPHFSSCGGVFYRA